MGLFNRKHREGALVVDAQPEVIGQPVMRVADLEQMIHTTYQEKLSLERQLDDAKAKIKRFEEQETKLHAAEEFSRQSERERIRAEEKAKGLQIRIDDLEGQLKQEQAKNTTLEIRVSELSGGFAEAVESAAIERLDELKRQVEEQGGNWSKSRIVEFIDKFQQELGGDA